MSAAEETGQQAAENNARTSSEQSYSSDSRKPVESPINSPLRSFLLIAGVAEKRCDETVQLLEREHIDTVPLLFANLNLLTNALPIATHTTLMNYRQLHAVSFPEPQQPSGPMHAHTPPRAALASLRSDTAAHNPRALRNQDSVEASPRKVTEWWLARNGEHHDGVGADADLRADPVEVIAHRSPPGLAPSVYQATPMQDTLLCGEWESHSGE